ncbi:MAG: hypothetical protein F2934_03080 [Actinobacteria bacterium]|uniref:Unannotated protein n=1 Tax=freshwater metagenome TaxID=449393 RepID=A0A6J7TXS3_9ZZZZ|nr:hypothetical protein [Actinomycetota bacterium]MSY13455.1 hypothetical protein [Actinomycetota bacterium]MSZ03925.1 hypothetical protein [Actinomycetota bacterium]MTB06097.1 hypothetical protein [Actinomycetota bacterium]
MTPRRSRPALFVPAFIGTVVVALLGCGSGSSAPIRSSTSASESTTAGVSTTDTPTTEPPNSTGQTTAAPSTSIEESDTVCGALQPIGLRARVISTGEVDWSGSGRRDTTVTVYETAPDTADFRIRVDRGGAGSEMAIILTNPAESGPPGGAPVTGEPAFIVATQVDSAVSGTNPEELLVRVGFVAPRELNGVLQSGGYDVAVFFRYGNGCIDRFRGADDLELVFPIRAGGPSMSGLACVSEEDPAHPDKYLVRTTASRKQGRNVPSALYVTHEYPQIRGGSTATPAGTTSAQLLDGADTADGVLDYQNTTSPLLRYSSITGCDLDSANIGDHGDEQVDDGDSPSDGEHVID